MINFLLFAKLIETSGINKTKSKNCYIFDFMQAYLDAQIELLLKVHNFVVHKVVNLVFFNYFCNMN